MGNISSTLTLADVFAFEWESTDLLEKLSALLANQRPVEVVAGDDATFGPPEKPVQVTLMKKAPELQKLHDDIIALLTENGAVFNDPQCNGKVFISHATVQKHARLNKGDPVKISILTILGMFPQSNGYRRKLLRTINFSE